jgi:hypothetical protein
MMTQEEQLRQNMVEMMANQEEMIRKEAEYPEIIKDLQKNLTNQLN